MTWFEALSEIEDLEDAEFDRALVDGFERLAELGDLVAAHGLPERRARRIR